MLAATYGPSSPESRPPTRPSRWSAKTVIYLANLAPRKIRGVLSQGMILAAGGDEVLALSGPGPGRPARDTYSLAFVTPLRHPLRPGVVRKPEFFPCFVTPRRR